MAKVNGELSFLDYEVNPVIDAIIAKGLVFQAFHQHYIDEAPQIWHVHVRGMDDPITLAQSIAYVVNGSGTPLPQPPPPNSTPLPANDLDQILGGMPQIMSDGVVLIGVPRKESIQVGGVTINPFLAVQTHVRFEPLNNSGALAAAGPDFGMIYSEINPVVQTMRGQGFQVDCLYNQETDENPQLYWSHMFAVGDPVQLAQAIRAGWDKMNLVLS